MKTLLCVLSLAICLGTNAQKDMDSTVWNANTFDFWVGNWELTWKNANGEAEHGTNKIERTLKGAVIQENFEASDGGFKGYVGKSWTVWNAKTKQWKQTWVDNQGAYLDFTGTIVDGKPCFAREVTNAAGKTVKQRMVFYKITKDGFMWDWENSQDGGKTWKLAWRIEYVRVK